MATRKVYHITGYLYVPLDGKVLASSQKEAREKWLQALPGDNGFTYEPRVHECILNTDNNYTVEDFTEKQVIFTTNNYAVE